MQMRKTTKTTLALALQLSAVVALHAQDTRVSGVIKDQNGIPVEGALIENVSSMKKVLTDSTGAFSILANKGAKLTVTAMGFETKKIEVDGSSISLTLEPTIAQMQDVIVGTRSRSRSIADLAVPVDVVSVNKMSTTMSRPDLMSQLMVAIPSFNYNKQSGADISDAVDFATLRGMGYDHTLVLINGKRRHFSAYVNLGGKAGSGSDLNTIPQGAIDHVEVLRDGASAQYGSDAIAGVVNIVLKKKTQHLYVSSGWSGFYDHKYNTLKSADPSKYYTGSKVDGNAVTTNLDWGQSIGNKGGYLNIGGTLLAQGKTFRGNPDNETLVQTRRAFGNGSVESAGGIYNFSLPLSDNLELYSFGGYNAKHSNAYAWTRAWSNPLRFPTNSNGDIVFLPNIMKVQSSSNDSISANNVYYNPQEDVYMKDYSAALGIKGRIDDWNWDLSNNTGHSDVHIWGNKTFNASLPYPEQYTKTRFNDGGFNYLLNVSNLDVNKHFANVFKGLTFAFGGEFRYEKYNLYAGEPDSYRNGGATLPDGRSKASGSQGYPGYQPSDAVKAHRTNVGGYLDFSFDLTDRWLLDLAARFENYSDFGFVNVYKVATRYKLTDQLNLRGSFSTGFRAPTLQELNFSNTNTTIVNGELQYTKLVPNYSSLARLAGIPKLKQETSKNYSLGFAWTPSHNFTATVDGYLIKMKNRIVTTGNYDTSNASLKDYLVDNNLTAVSFFTNAVNTTNKGVDIVLDYHQYWGANHFSTILTGNIQTVTIDHINIPSELGSSYLAQQQFFGTQPQYMLKSSAPKAKFMLNPEYGTKSIDFGARVVYWGKITMVGSGSASVPGATAGGPGSAGISDAGLGWDPYVELDNGSGVVPEQFIYGGKFTTDFYVNFKLSKKIQWVMGADNIFNVHPDPSYTKGAKVNSWNESNTGGYFDNVQMGFNGMRMYSKLTVTL